jgi:lipopolysaccharide transport system ATP-binding protein
MSETPIKVENLSKQYRIGSKEGYKTLRETLVDAAKAPFQRLQEAWRMAHGAWSNREDSQRPAPRPLHEEGTSKLQAPSPLPPSQRDDLVWALKDVSFEVKKGEIVGIIGRNGAGKSTLLKILSKITYPTEGRVELTGRVGSLLEVGTGFHPELTGHENVYLYGAILGMDRWEITRKFDEIIEFAELEKFVDTPVKRYSSGMYMRLAFAVAGRYCS